MRGHGHICGASPGRRRHPDALLHAKIQHPHWRPAQTECLEQGDWAGKPKLAGKPYETKDWKVNVYEKAGKPIQF